MYRMALVQKGALESVVQLLIFVESNNMFIRKTDFCRVVG